MYIGRVGTRSQDQYEADSKMEFIFFLFGEVVGEGEEVVGEEGGGLIEGVDEEIGEVEVVLGLVLGDGGHVIYF